MRRIAKVAEDIGMKALEYRTPSVITRTIDCFWREYSVGIQCGSFTLADSTMNIWNVQGIGKFLLSMNNTNHTTNAIAI
jgi:hypothetical protein